MTGDVWRSAEAFSDRVDAHTLVRRVQNVPGDNGLGGFRIAVHVRPECACAVFSLTTEARKEDQSSRVPPFEALRHANAGCANDLWTEEDEWEGSLWDI